MIWNYTDKASLNYETNLKKEELKIYLEKISDDASLFLQCLSN